METPPKYRADQSPLAKKTGDKPSKIVLELSRARKAAYVRAAKPGTLAGWIFALLDRASGFRQPEPEREARDDASRKASEQLSASNDRRDVHEHPSLSHRPRKASS